ncbi:hypothetical protein ACHAXR_012860 [Thalassiosira sp. AJA248-18]
MTGARPEIELGPLSSPSDGCCESIPQSPASATEPTTTIVDEAQECLAQSLLMFLYADLRLLSATGRINTKFETLCIDSDRVPRTTAAEMAQLAGNELPRDIASVNDSCEGVSPGQIMAILIVELRQEVLAQRQRAKDLIKKQQDKKGGWQVPTLSGEEDDDEESDDDDDDAGVMNKITDRKGRKEFETDMHALIRSYNNMLAQDLKGIPEVKLERMFANRLRRATKTGQKKPWLRPGGLTQRLFSFDDMLENNQAEGQDSDDEGSKKSQGSVASLTRRMSIAARLTGSLLRKQREQTDLVIEESEKPSEGDRKDVNDSVNSNGAKASGSNVRPQLSLIEESKSEDEQPDEPTVQVSESEKGVEGEINTTSGKMNQSTIFEFLRGAKASQTVEFDLQSLKSDPGPNQSWRGDISEEIVSSRPPFLGGKRETLTKQLTQHFKNKVETYREDHVIHNKLIIPTDDYETFAGAEDVGNKLVQMTSNMNLTMSSVPEFAEGAGDPSRNMSENELLDFMTRCIQSRNTSSLDFMADFFRDDTVSQTMVKSKAKVVWLQDWFPIKDCIYAISVDKIKKRVLVVFRGAITLTDWSHGFDAAMKKGHNPVKDDYEGRKMLLKYHRGFYTYLFRVRKDTSTRKYDEIANKVYEYGTKMIGSDFTVTVNGYSLGGALSVLFGFHASTDDRFTQNGPVKIFSYGAPMAVSHSFADAFRHQEKKRKVQHARFYNSNDVVPYMPFNVKPTSRGSNFVHVGIDVKLYSVPGSASLWGSRYPRFHYNKRLSGKAAYWNALKMNALLNMPFPWQMKDKHGLPELQKRIERAIVVAEAAKTTTTKKPYLRSTLDEAYEAMVYKKNY